MIGIYLIRNKFTGKCYVGQSLDISRRIRDHQSGRDSNRHYIDRAIQKHGIDTFTFEVLELCEERELNQREIHWIASSNTVYPHGYNLMTGGKGSRHSLETRRKISESQKGEKAYWFGKTPSVETRRKLSKSLKGRQHSDETRQKLSKANTGKRRSTEQRKAQSERMKGNRPWNKGKRKVKKSSPLQFNLF